jgi:hypothetical protein
MLIKKIECTRWIRKCMSRGRTGKWRSYFPSGWTSWVVKFTTFNGLLDAHAGSTIRFALTQKLQDSIFRHSFLVRRTLFHRYFYYWIYVSYSCIIFSRRCHYLFYNLLLLYSYVRFYSRYCHSSSTRIQIIRLCIYAVVFFDQTKWHKYGRAGAIKKNTDANKNRLSYMHVVCKVSTNIRNNFLRKGWRCVI